MLFAIAMTTSNRTAPQGPRLRLAAAAGVTTPVLFVAVFLVEGWVRPGYQPSSMFVSELSLGPRGWVQIVNFLLSGGLLIGFARTAAPYLRGGIAGTAGPVLLQIIGLSLMASGPFVTDSSALFDQRTVHGLIHGVFGAVVFSLMPVSCLVFYRRFRRDPAWRRLVAWTLAVALALIVGIGLLKMAQQPGSVLFPWRGLVQRTVLITFMSWVLTVAAHLLSANRVDTAAGALRHKP